MVKSSDSPTRSAATEKHPPLPTDATVSLGWHDLTRWAFAEAQIDLTDEQFHRAWRCLWQSAFMGDNYTLDAKRVLAAAFGRGETA